MKTILTAMALAAFTLTPAAACGWMKNKDVTASVTVAEPEKAEAITTFDPQAEPVFETEADAVEDDKVTAEGEPTID